MDSQAIDEPYIRLRRVEGEWVHQGAATCSLGHRIPRAGDQGDDGVFAGWVWDGSTLHAYNDRFGFIPLYYFERGTEIGISTSILRLLTLGAPAELDHAALSVYLRLGCFLASDTAFRRIRALPAGSRFEWREGKLHIAGGTKHAARQGLTRESAIDAYLEVFKQAIQRRSPPAEDFAVPLSGGRDSRHILFELCAAGYRPKFCATAQYFPPGDAEGEIKIASEVTRVVGARHVVIDQPDEQWEAERRSNAETDFCTSDAAWTLALADYMKGRIRWMYDGIGGDVLSAGLFLTDRRVELFGSSRLPELAEDLFDADPDPEMFTPSVRKALGREVAVDRCVAELERHLDAPNPLGSFIFWNRTRRKIAMSSYRVLARAGEVFAPYVDHDVFDLLSGLPAEMFLDHTFHTAAIARGYSEHAWIPYSTRQPGGAPRHHPAIRRFAMALITHGVQHGPSELVRRGYFVPRLMRCIVDRKYGSSISWLGQFMLYLLQLEEATRQTASRSADVAQVGEVHVKARVRSP